MGGPAGLVQREMYPALLRQIFAADELLGVDIPAKLLARADAWATAVVIAAIALLAARCGFRLRAAHACDTFDDYLFRIARRYVEVEHRSAPKWNARRTNLCGVECERRRSRLQCTDSFGGDQSKVI